MFKDYKSILIFEPRTCFSLLLFFSIRLDWIINLMIKVYYLISQISYAKRNWYEIFYN